MDYYVNLFQESEGDNYCMRKALNGCKLFDPMFLKGKENEIHTLLYLINDLSFFKYTAFNEGFFVSMKNELPLAIEHANMAFEWDTIETCKQFQTRMQKRKKRYKLEANDILDCRDDPGERARMIWEWWRVRLLSDTNIFPAFRKCLHLVVLSQTSSCAIERVFSRLKMIRDTCGESTYENMAEIRVLMQYNGNLSEFAHNF